MGAAKRGGGGGSLPRGGFLSPSFGASPRCRCWVLMLLLLAATAAWEEGGRAAEVSGGSGATGEEENGVLGPRDLRQEQQPPFPPEKGLADDDMAAHQGSGGGTITTKEGVPLFSDGSPSTSAAGYHIPPSKMTFRHLYAEGMDKGSWLVVNVKPDVWYLRWRHWASRPKLDKRLQRDGLSVYRVTCAAARNRARLNACLARVWSRTPRRLQGFSRVTFEIDELRRVWMIDYLSAHPDLPTQTGFAVVSIFFKCQMPTGWDVKQRKRKRSSKCLGGQHQTFHPARFEQYHFNVLGYKFIGFTEDLTTTPSKYTAVGGNDAVISSNDARLTEMPSQRAVTSWVDPLNDNEETPREGPYRFYTRGVRQAERIAVIGALPPKIFLRRLWSQKKRKDGWRFMQVPWELFPKNPRNAFSFVIKQPGETSRDVLVEAGRKVSFHPVVVPEILYARPTLEDMLPPTGPPGELEAEGEESISSQGQDGDSQPELAKEVLLLRLEKPGRLGSVFKKQFVTESHKLKNKTTTLTIFTCRVKSDLDEQIRRCLQEIARRGIGAQVVYVTSDRAALLESFVYIASSLQQISQPPESSGNAAPGWSGNALPPVQQWRYALEGGWTGKNKLLVEGKVGMTGLTESRVIKTNFSVSLWFSYAKLVAGIPQIALGATDEGELGNLERCLGELRVDFAPSTWELSYAVGPLHEQPSWISLPYPESPLARISLHVGLIRRFIHDYNFYQDLDIPGDWTGLQLEKINKDDTSVLSFVCPGHQGGENIRESTQLIISLERDIEMRSPTLVDSSPDSGQAVDLSIADKIKTLAIRRNSQDLPQTTFGIAATPTAERSYVVTDLPEVPPSAT